MWESRKKKKRLQKEPEEIFGALPKRELTFISHLSPVFICINTTKQH